MPDLHARFPAPIITLAPLFVQRSWLHAQALAVGPILAPRRRQEHEALVAARAAAEDPAVIAGRKRRAGIEGTSSKAVRVNGLRRSRHIGVAKAYLQQVLTAAAINLGRTADWTAGSRPAQTRKSAFVRLMAAPARAGPFARSFQIGAIPSSPQLLSESRSALSGVDVPPHGQGTGRWVNLRPNRVPAKARPVRRRRPSSLP